MAMVDPRTFPRKWGAAIASGSVKNALSMYSSNAVLVPTYSSEILQGHKQMAPYFREFMGRPNMQVAITKVVLRKSAATPVVSGFYTITWGNAGPNEKPAMVKTHLRDMEPFRNGQGNVDWRALTHHSSVVP